MKRAAALALLGLEKTRCDLTAEIVQEAFRTMVKRIHPDAGHADALAGTKMVQIQDARDLLLKNLDGLSDFACVLCSGIGMVRASLGWRTCSACKGTGDKR